MIVCKIVAGFDQPEGNLNGLFDHLAKQGDFLFTGSLFFSSVEENITTKKLANILKKYGFDSAYIEEYSNQHLPKEDNSTNGWITDQMVRNNAYMYEKTSQESFKTIRDKLHELNNITERLITKAQLEQNQKQQLGGEADGRRTQEKE